MATSPLRLSNVGDSMLQAVTKIRVDMFVAQNRNPQVLFCLDRYLVSSSFLRVGTPPGNGDTPENQPPGRSWRDSWRDCSP